MNFFEKQWQLNFWRSFDLQSNEITKYVLINLNWISKEYDQNSEQLNMILTISLNPLFIILVYQYNCPNLEIYTPLYTDIFYHRLCFFLLTLNKFSLQVSKHTLSIINYSKIEKYIASGDFI